MLKKETLAAIAKLTKLKVEDLEAAIKNEAETDLTIAELTVFTDEELQSRDLAQKKAGETVGREIGIKEVKKAAGLPEDAPAKDPLKVAQAIADKATAESKVKPDEKVTQLTEQVSLLQKQLTEKDSEVATAKGLANQVALDRKILSAFPKERADNLDDDDYLTIIKRNHSFEELDGKLIVKKDGELLRDAKTTNPLAVKDVVSNIFTERKWTAQQGGAGGGRGAGDKGGTGGFTKKSQVIAKYEAEGKSITGEFSQQLVAELAELKKTDPSFDMEN